MRERRPSSIAQPGMTAWGRAAERELDAYVRDTALRVPLELPDRVMAAIEARSPSRQGRWLRLWSALDPGRLRLAGSMVVVLVGMLGGAALVAGASALLSRDVATSTYPSPDRQPVIVAEPSATPSAEIDHPSPWPVDAAGSTKPPQEPMGPDPDETIDDRDAPEGTHAPEATDEPDETDEPEATDDGGGTSGGTDQPHETDGPDGTDQPSDSGSGGGSGESGGSEGSGSNGS